MTKSMLVAISLLCIFPFTPHAAPLASVRSADPATPVTFTGEERISKPFTFDIELPISSMRAEAAFRVGLPATLQLAPGLRVSGIVTSLEQSADSYRIRLVSSLGRLGYRVASRTFADMSVVDVIRNVLRDAGITAVEFRLTGAYVPRGLTVQYRESDLAFVSRLLEREGIHYHFEPTASGETLVFSDANSGLPKLPAAPLSFSPQGAAVSSFLRGQALAPGQIRAGDYDWKKPQLNLTRTAQSAAFPDLVENIFPAGITDPQRMQAFANRQLEAHAAGSQRCQGESAHPGIRAGYRFTLAGHPVQSFNQEYVITSVRHRKGADGYRNAFTCLPVEITYRDLQTTPIPTIAGVVSGIVVGPSGDTKHVNEYGQVKVRFPWRDPSGTPAGNGDTGWVRVMQPAAGKGTTAMWLPEVDDEVLVAFENGDPERPVVLGGGLFNGNAPPPLALPASKEKSLFRVQSAANRNTDILLDNTANGEGLTLRSGTSALFITPREILLDGTANSEGLILRSGSTALIITPRGITATTPIATPAPPLQQTAPAIIRR